MNLKKAPLGIYEREIRLTALKVGLLWSREQRSPCRQAPIL
jgi:hypothetical protein